MDLNFDRLWDFSHPEETEIKFQNLLSHPEILQDQDRYLQLLTQIARTQGLQRKFDKAHETLKEVEEKISSTTPIARIRYFLEKGRTFNSSGKQEEALPLFLQAWEAALEAGQDGYAVDAAHMMAIAEKPENQLEWNLKALALCEKSSQKEARNWMGSLYNNIGWTYFDQKEYEKAKELFEKAWGWRKEQGSPETIRIAKWCVAKVLRFLGEVEKSLGLQKELEKEYEEIQEPSGYVFEEIAECLLLSEEKEKARPYFSQAYKILSKDPWLQAEEQERLGRLKSLGDLL